MAVLAKALEPKENTWRALHKVSGWNRAANASPLIRRPLITGVEFHPESRHMHVYVGVQLSSKVSLSLRLAIANATVSLSPSGYLFHSLKHQTSSLLCRRIVSLACEPNNEPPPGSETPPSLRLVRRGKMR